MTRDPELSGLRPEAPSLDAPGLSHLHRAMKGEERALAELSLHDLLRLFGRELGAIPLKHAACDFAERALYLLDEPFPQALETTRAIIEREAGPIERVDVRQAVLLAGVEASKRGPAPAHAAEAVTVCLSMLPNPEDTLAYHARWAARVATLVAQARWHEQRDEQMHTFYTEIGWQAAHLRWIVARHRAGRNSVG